MNHQNYLLFFPPFINLYVLVFFLISETSFAVDIHYQTCSVQKTCGRQNISFPFYIADQQPPYCGFPGFQLSCIDDDEDGYATLRLAGDEYLVHSISYQNQTLVVSNAALSKLSTAVCIPIFQNITFPTDQYELVQNQKEIVLLYNCNSALVDESFSEYRIGCFELTRGTRTSVLALPGDQHQLLANVSGKCSSKVVVTTVENYGSDFIDQLGVEEVLRRGFVMKWRATNCNHCEKSGGKCGFDFESYRFSCFCADRPHRVSCKGKGQFFMCLPNCSSSVYHDCFEFIAR